MDPDVESTTHQDELVEREHGIETETEGGGGDKPARNNETWNMNWNGTES
jgi:hypothetical protein